NEAYYKNLAGGILEAFGRLFKYELRLYVAPCLNQNNDELTTTENFAPEPHLKHLYSYLYDNQYIKSLNRVNRDYLCIHSHEVLDEIKNGRTDWEHKVPDKVKDIIKNNKLLNYT
ncbi:MAG: TonB-dependent receptor, partial [Gammaproteobacteria bacterium]|nr:TonB-dependent receptor [Gammaproteobacteria bacterium]